MTEPVIDITPDPDEPDVAVRKAEAYRSARIGRNSLMRGDPTDIEMAQALLQLVVLADELAVAVLNRPAAQHLDEEKEDGS